jgi:low affinity Fe/Cu permease
VAERKLERTRFDRFADRTATVTSRASFFVLCLLMVLIWLPSYFLFRDGDTWQLVIGTVTNVLTFLLVALIQNTQWRSEKAVNVKLNAIAEGLADLMRFQMGEDSDLHDDLAQLQATVGLEDRVSPTQ